MRFDAVVLSGGRSSRLGGSPKSELVVGGRSLLELALDAVAGASRVAVVGDRPVPASGGQADAAAPDGSAGKILFTREHPRFAGPAAAIASGIRALERDGAQETSAGHASRPEDFTAVVACDMPGVAAAIEALLTESARVRDSPSIAGFVAADENGTAQLLVGLYRTSALRHAIDAREDLVNMSVRSLVSELELEAVAVPVGSTHDIDTWEDAARLGAVPPATEGETL